MKHFNRELGEISFDELKLSLIWFTSFYTLKEGLSLALSRKSFECRLVLSYPLEFENKIVKKYVRTVFEPGIVLKNEIYLVFTRSFTRVVLKKGLWLALS